MSKTSKSMFGCGSIILIFVLIIFLLFAGPYSCGIYPFGPTKEISATVLSKHVDINLSNDNSQSFYMVTTDAGTFEVENSFILGIYNADEIYGKLVPGETYTVKIKGNKIVNFFLQEYPRVIEVK